MTVTFPSRLLLPLLVVPSDWAFAQDLPNSDNEGLLGYVLWERGRVGLVGRGSKVT